MKEQSRLRKLGRKQGRSLKLSLKLVQPITMDVVKVDLPARVTIFRVMTVERFAVLVLAVGASVGRLHRAYATAVLGTMGSHDWLAIHGNNLTIVRAWVWLPGLRGRNVNTNTRRQSAAIRFRTWMVGGSGGSGIVTPSDRLVNHLRCKHPKEEIGRLVASSASFAKEVGINNDKI